MTCRWFYEQICEELEGAKSYILSAFKVRPMSEDWAKSLMAMSAAELEHAAIL